jgi:HSP20 family protein
MNLQQLNPWNWFTHEEPATGATIPVKRTEINEKPSTTGQPMLQLHREIDRLFDDVFRGVGFSNVPSRWTEGNLFNGLNFHAKINIASDEKNYHVSLEAPGLTEEDISLALHQGVLTIRGEKKAENETKDRHYYRVERSYGSFQRVLALPDDCDQEAISANMKNGVLEITLPRKVVPASATKHIPIH